MTAGAALSALLMTLAALAQSVSELPDDALAAPPEPTCRAYTSDLEEQLPTELTQSGLPERAAALQWVRPTTAIYIAPFSAATETATAHTGVDYVHNDPSVAAVPVVAAAAGTIVYVRDGCPQSDTFTPNLLRRECGGGWGNQVVIRHTAGLYTRYGHLEADIASDTGQAVQAGEHIAFMGTSGRAMLRHLHFELGTAPADPYSCDVITVFSQTYDPALLGI